MALITRQSKNFARAICTLLVAASVSRAMAAPQADSAEAPKHYYYFKERRELPLDSTRIAVQRRPGAADDIASIVSPAGLSVSNVEPLPIAQWSLIENPTTERSSGAISRRLGALAGLADIDFASPVYIGSDGGPIVVTPNLLVGFASNIDDKRARAILDQFSAGIVLDRDWAGMRGVYRVQARSRRGDQVLAAANALAVRPEVRFAEPDMILTGKSDVIPNDQFFTFCWGLNNTGQSGGTPDMDMNAPEAWDITTGSPSVITVILDTGVQQDHPDLNQIPGIDFTGQGGSGGPMNACENHGTAVAGCISATMNNFIGIAGIAPDTRIASARTFVANLTPCNGNWTAQTSWTVNALAWAETIGARVTNNSNGYGFSSSTIEFMYQQTWTDGIVHFASAGNDSSSTITYPASIPVVNAVAALNRFGALAFFSNFGNGIDFSAPGQSIVSTDRTGNAGYVNGDYTTVDDTSFAAPYTAGIAALLLSRNPELTAAQVEHALQVSCRDLGTPGYDLFFGWGLVNARDALSFLGDCNQNGIDDAIELASGAATDCNINGVPDDCDLNSGLLTDFDQDQRPDQCGCGAFCPGDLDLDFMVDGRDIQLFLNCVTVGDLAVNDCGCTDLNNDLRLDTTDIDLFIDKLLTDPDPSCP